MAKTKNLVSRHPQVRKLLKEFGGSVVKPARIGQLTAGQGLPAGFADREMVSFVNDPDTVAFEIPLARLTGAAGLHFSQEVWMVQPSAFEYVTLGEVAIIRLWWDRDAGPALLNKRATARETSPMFDLT